MAQQRELDHLFLLAPDPFPSPNPQCHLLAVENPDPSSTTVLPSPFGTPPNLFDGESPASDGRASATTNAEDPIFLLSPGILDPPLAPHVKENIQSHPKEELVTQIQETHVSPFSENKVPETDTLPTNALVPPSDSQLHTTHATNQDTTRQCRDVSLPETILSIPPTPENDLHELLELGTVVPLPGMQAPNDGSFTAQPIGSSSINNSDNNIVEQREIDAFVALEELLDAPLRHGASSEEPLSVSPAHQILDNISFTDPPSQISSSVVASQKENNNGQSVRSMAAPESGWASEFNVLSDSHRVNSLMTIIGEYSVTSNERKRKTTDEQDFTSVVAMKRIRSGEQDSDAAIVSTSQSQANKKQSTKKLTTILQLCSTPSRFCHICTRSAKQEDVLVCANLQRGTCRKVVCNRCIRDLKWDWGIMADSKDWLCTHCRKVSFALPFGDFLQVEGSELNTPSPLKSSNLASCFILFLSSYPYSDVPRKSTVPHVQARESESEDRWKTQQKGSHYKRKPNCE